jgi:hypothetical protein
LFPLKINRFEIHNGEIHFRNFSSDPKVDIYLNKVFATAENLTNSKDISKTLMASINARGKSMQQGSFILNADINPFEEDPTFDLNVELKNLDLKTLNSFIKAYGNFDIEEGMFEVYGEFVAANGKFEGYVKPIFRNMKVFSLSEDSENPLQLFWEAIVGTVTSLLENQPKDQFAAKIPFSGNFEDPDANIWSTIGSILENAFIRALIPNVEGTINLEQVE